jgi:hypothetical protein
MVQCRSGLAAGEDGVRKNQDLRAPALVCGASPRPREAVFLALCAACLTLASPAEAGLGGGYASVEADRDHLAASLHSTAAATHMVHQLIMANGAVHEYARGDGVVFAVTWQGPARPDLRQLLGGYFDRFQADNALHGGRRARRPLSVNQVDLIVQSGGHPGAFRGVAYLPQLAPPGFSISDLK